MTQEEQVWRRAQPIVHWALAHPTRAEEAQRRIKTLCENTKSPLDTAVHLLVETASDKPNAVHDLYHSVFASVLRDVGHIAPGDFKARAAFQTRFELEHRRAHFALPACYEDQMAALENFVQTSVGSAIFGWVYHAEAKKLPAAASDDARKQMEERAVARCLELSKEPWGQFSAKGFLDASTKGW